MQATAAIERERAPVRSPLRPRPDTQRRPYAARPQHSKAQKRRAFRFGVESERLIASFLHAGDYKIIASRARVGDVEVDLIVARDDEVAFVEVKARRDLWQGLEAVTPAKMKRLARAADRWLASNEAYANCSIRFDIALVGAQGALEYLENAFEYQEPQDFVF